jgi:hypothetical protein
MNIPTVPQRRRCNPGRLKVRHLTAEAATAHANAVWKKDRARGVTRGTPVVYLCATCSAAAGQDAYHFGHDNPSEELPR